jgi:hypothetical protein
MIDDRIDRYVSRLTSNPDAARGFVVFTTDSFRGPDGTPAGYIGGLADRIKGLITSFLIAVATDRIFIVDWKRPFALEPVLQPNRWDWRPTTWLDRMGVPDAILLLHMIGRSVELEAHAAAGIEEHLLRRVRVVYLNLNGFSGELVSRLFPGSSASAVFKHAFETLFAFHSPPQFARLWAVLDKIKQAREPLVGVHLRTGQGNGWEDPRFADWRQYEHTLRVAFAQAAKLGHVKPAYYFASDSARAKEAVRTTDWGRTVLCSDFPVAHMDRSFGMDREPFDHAIVEFMILRSCDLVIGGAGGFWSTAAMAGGRESFSLSQAEGKT